MACRMIAAAICAALLTTALRADEDRDRKAKAAFALAATASPVAGAVPCGCDKCECGPGKCARERITPYDEAFTRAQKAGIPVVLFCDLPDKATAVRCCGDAIPTRTLITRTSFRPEKPIAVIAPLPNGVQRIVGTFPADVPRKVLLDCVRDAKKVMDDGGK